MKDGEFAAYSYNSANELLSYTYTSFMIDVSVFAAETDENEDPVFPSSVTVNGI